MSDWIQLRLSFAYGIEIDSKQVVDTGYANLQFHNYTMQFVKHVFTRYFTDYCH